MADDPLFDFAVPHDLLQEAVAHVQDPAVVADLAVMPGTGEGKPPPLVGILNQSGWAPLVLLTAAALVPGTFGNGISLIGRNLETSFHMSNAALGAVAFIAPGVPAAVDSTRSHSGPTGAAARWWPPSPCWCSPGFGKPHGDLSPNVWWVRLLVLRRRRSAPG